MMCNGKQNCCSTCSNSGDLSLDLTPGEQGIIRAGHFARDADLHVIGTAAGVTEIPSHRIVVGGDVLGYEQLFSEITPEGGAMVYRNPGTFGTLYAAGRRL